MTLLTRPVYTSPTNKQSAGESTPSLAQAQGPQLKPKPVHSQQPPAQTSLVSREQPTTQQINLFQRRFSNDPLSPEAAKAVLQHLRVATDLENVGDLTKLMSGDLNNLTDLHPTGLNQLAKLFNTPKNTQGDVALVFDYDGDGIAAAAIMKQTLEALGHKTTLVANHPYKGGHAPDKEQVAQLQGSAPSAILALDWGTGADFSSFTSANISVGVLDHHSVGKSAPEESDVKLVNPVLKPKNNSETSLCTAGLALLLANKLLKESTLEQEFVQEIQKSNTLLAALGSRSDRVTPSIPNFAIFSAANKLLEEGYRPAFIDALLSVHQSSDGPPKKVSRFQHKPSIETLGDAIMPGLTAVGKTNGSGAESAVRLLTCSNREAMKSDLEDIKAARACVRESGRTALQSARLSAKFQAEKPCILIRGVIPEAKGTVSAVIAREHPSKPCIVCTPERDGLIKANIRIQDGPRQTNLVQILEEVEDVVKMTPEQPFHFEFGGHPRAAGFTISSELLPAFKKAFEQAWREQKMIMGLSARR